MNWYRIAAASAFPIIIAAPIVAFCFHQRRFMTGRILGSSLFFVGFVFFAAWQFSEALNHGQSRTDPSVFTKIAVFGFVAMLQVMALFLLGDSAEKKITDKDRSAAYRKRKPAKGRKKTTRRKP